MMRRVRRRKKTRRRALVEVVQRTMRMFRELRAMHQRANTVTSGMRVASPLPLRAPRLLVSYDLTPGICTGWLYARGSRHLLRRSNIKKRRECTSCDIPRVRSASAVSSVGAGLTYARRR